MNTSKEVAVFDPKAYVDAIRERIKGAAIDMIPPDAWDAMIKKELSDFFEPQTDKDYRGNVISKSESRFEKAIRVVLETDAKKKVSEMLLSPEWADKWEPGVGEQRAAASEKIQELVLKNSGEIMNSWISVAFQNAVMSMRGHLR